MARLIAWWSAGTTSAVACALAVRELAPAFDEVVVAYCASVESAEHPDNARFRVECEQWYGVPIARLYSAKYADLTDVFEKRKYVAGIGGAPCTQWLKKAVREEFQRDDDVHVFGFDDGEHDRAADFAASHEIAIRFPLIERGLSHQDCDAIVAAAGIALPAMYRLGYKNNNCIGCVKGGAGYWNKIRRDFPDVFAQRAEMTRRLGCRLLAITIGGVRKRIFLDELPEGVGRYEAEPAIECGIGCTVTLNVIARKDGAP